MKIGMISPFLPEKCGVAIYTENLIKNLDCDVIKIGKKGSDVNYQVNFKSLNLKSRLKKIIEKEQLELLHLQYNASLFGKYTLNAGLINALSLSSHLPIVVTLHEVQYPDERFRTKILQFIEKQIVKGSTKVIVHTPQQAEFIKRKYRTKKAECIYMGVDVKQNKPKKGKNILFFGMMSEGKGVLDLIKAKKYLLEYRLKIVGRPVTEEYRRKVLEAVKGKDIWIKLGWISEKEKDSLYRWANIVVLPYRWAPYQSAILHDAISYSLPVVVTKVGAVWEIVDKFKSGEIIQPESPKRITEGVEKIYEKYRTYLTGIKEYQNIANLRETAKKYQRMYCELLYYS